MKSIKKNYTSKLKLLFTTFVIAMLVLESQAVKLNNLGLGNDLQEAWNRLFTDPTRSTLTCKKKEDEKTPQETQGGASADGNAWSVPKKKKNYYAMKQIGWGPSSYLFDFLDDVLQSEIVVTFKRIFDEAKNIKVTPNYKDPYSLDNITQMKGNEADLLKKLSSLMSGSDGKSTFDEKVWRSSINAAQINQIQKDWQWFTNKNSADPAKELVDKFDFNGDGRLSPKEFIIAMIENNKLLSISGKCKNCMENVIKKTLEPIFMYLDCTSEEKINSESLWNNLQKLKRSKPNAFNYYLCNFQNGNFRTTSCNDFVIKAKKTMDGYINKSEFIDAILIGYWVRHVDDRSIYQDNTLNMRALRWNDIGTVDKVCESLKSGK